MTSPEMINSIIDREFIFLSPLQTDDFFFFFVFFVIKCRVAAVDINQTGSNHTISAVIK